MQRGASRLSASPRVLSTAFSDRVFCRAPRIARFSGLSLTTNNPFPLRTPVTTFMRGAEALKTLRERRDDFDIVLSDVHMPDMDGFKLLEHIALELDVPVMGAYPAPNLRSPRDGFPVRPARRIRRPLSRPSLADPISPPRARLRSDVRELRHRCRPARHHPRRRGLPPEAVPSRSCATSGGTWFDADADRARRRMTREVWKPAGAAARGGSRTREAAGRRRPSRRGMGAAGRSGKKDRDDSGWREHGCVDAEEAQGGVSAELHQQFVTAVTSSGSIRRCRNGSWI